MGFGGGIDRKKKNNWVNHDSFHTTTHCPLKCMLLEPYGSEINRWVGGGKGGAGTIETDGLSEKNDRCLPVWDSSCHCGRVIVNVAGHGFEKIGQVGQVGWWSSTGIYCC